MNNTLSNASVTPPVCDDEDQLTLCNENNGAGGGT